MRTTIGFINNSKNKAEKYTCKIPKPKSHSLTFGSTGSGKTVSVLHNIIKVNRNSGMLILDEKHTLHQFAKHVLGESAPERLYMLGNSVSKGTNDLRINILDIACGSDRATNEFFDSVVELEKSNGDHRYWAKSASNMIRDTYGFLFSIKQYLSFLAENLDTKYKNYSQTLFLPDDENSGNSDESLTFKIDSSPLTMRDLTQYMRDRKKFALIAHNANIIVQVLEGKVVRSISAHIERFFPNREQIEHLGEKMRSASEQMHQYLIQHSKFDQSGINGVYFSATSALSEGLGDIECLNAPSNSQDIVSLLEEGAHVVVNMESLPKIASNILANRILEKLSLRAKFHTPSSVCFVADEASRVFTSNSTLDEILSFSREANIKIHIATQSEAQIKLIFGELKYESMMENFIDIYSLSGKDKPLPTFHYHSLKEDRIFKSSPLIVEKKVLLMQEKKYQDITCQYTELELGLNEVVTFDTRLYAERGTVILTDMNTLEEKEVLYFPKKHEEDNETTKTRSSRTNSLFPNTK